MLKVTRSCLEDCLWNGPHNIIYSIILNPLWCFLWDAWNYHVWIIITCWYSTKTFLTKLRKENYKLCRLVVNLYAIAFIYLALLRRYKSFAKWHIFSLCSVAVSSFRSAHLTLFTLIVAVFLSSCSIGIAVLQPRFPQQSHTILTYIVTVFLSLSPQKGGRAYLISPPCLESQGFQFGPTFLYYLLFCSSA